MQLEFFKGIPLERESIALTLTPEGRPKGEAYVEFPTEEAQKEALGRHKDAMGERYIELFLSTKANMIQVMFGTCRMAFPFGLLCLAEQPVHHKCCLAAHEVFAACSYWQWLILKHCVRSAMYGLLVQACHGAAPAS